MAYKLKILTPVGVVLEEEQVVSANLTSSDGEIGILPGHVKYTGLLGTGQLKYTTSSNKQGKVSISEGFCKFSDDVLTVLADKASLS